jgi:hypothetical protein
MIVLFGIFLKAIKKYDLHLSLIIFPYVVFYLNNVSQINFPLIFFLI